MIEDFRHAAITNMNAKGLGESDGMAISGPKTNSISYGVQDKNRKSAVLDATEGD